VSFGGTINASVNPVAGVSVNSKAGLDLDAASQLNSFNKRRRHHPGELDAHRQCGRRSPDDFRRACGSSDADLRDGLV
jgi:hypothetical protein